MNTIYYLLYKVWTLNSFSCINNFPKSVFSPVIGFISHPGKIVTELIPQGMQSS